MIEFSQFLKGIIVRLKTNLLKYKLYLYLLVEKTMLKSHVNLFSCIIITVTNWNYLKSKLTLKQIELNEYLK